MEIQVEKEQKSPVEFDLRVTVPADEMRDRMDSRMSAIAKSASIPGFRKGKIPRKVLVQKYGEAITQDTVQEVLQESYRQALADSELDPVTPGEMSEVKFDQGEPLTYSVRVETMPDWDLPDLSLVKVDVLVPEVGDADVDHAIEGMRESSAILSPTDDPVSDDSQVTLDLQELDDSGVPIVGRVQKDVEIDMRRQPFGEDFAASIRGLSCEQEAVFQIPGRPDAEGKPTQQKLRATVRNIQRKELPDVDEQFARSVNANLNSVEELREDLRKYMLARANFQARQRMYREMADEILKGVEFPVPPRMLEDYLDRMAAEGVESSGQGRDEEKIKEFKENYRASAIWNLRWYIFRNRLIREHNLEVTEEDRQMEIQRLAVIDQSSPEVYRSKLTREQREGIDDDLMERKVFALLESKVQTESKSISLAEFEGRAEKKVISA